MNILKNFFGSHENEQNEPTDAIGDLPKISADTEIQLIKVRVLPVIFVKLMKIFLPSAYLSFFFSRLLQLPALQSALLQSTGFESDLQILLP